MPYKWACQPHFIPFILSFLPSPIHSVLFFLLSSTMTVNKPKSEEAIIEALRKNLEAVSLDLRNTQLDLLEANDSLASTQEELEDTEAKLEETQLELQNTRDALANTERARQAANLDRRKDVERSLKRFIAKNPELDAVIMDELRFDRSPRGHHVYQHIKDDKDAPIEFSRRNFALKNGHTEDDVIEYIAIVYNTHTQGSL
ncbi:hypothetical protein BC939DRAFT_533755 [Gamsiella multidivaricata]|uniref:uncharacterized protein n=1 Tax=Gamsiella multidivaricata TaxID=101098 RepID=UPI00222066CF|nr:uncharacterized protein BC939DRAFT_533755 [Gamsiella multidivaricata]KAI7816175.1 hypothetical protein BC939DRAFT_533755 [Gamsiella multidivaricata]